MRFPVIYRGQPAGTVEVQQTPLGCIFQAQSGLQAGQVLRLYGLDGERRLRIGVLEPGEQGLQLTRRLSAHDMRQQGIRQCPTRYYLDDGQPQESIPAVLPPGLPVQLRQAVESGAVQWQGTVDSGSLTAPFVPGQAHPLDFALTACKICRTEDGYLAVLRWENI